MNQPNCLHAHIRRVPHDGGSERTYSWECEGCGTEFVALPAAVDWRKAITEMSAPLDQHGAGSTGAPPDTFRNTFRNPVAQALWGDKEKGK